MNKSKHDYDSDRFYGLVGKLAENGLNDKEIADCLSLSYLSFSQMKNGCYAGWNAEQNKKRSERIKEILQASRRKVIAAVRTTYIKAALGHIRIKSKVLRHVEVACECGGGDPNCTKCGGIGRVPLSDRVIIQETETETPPNMQALATILHQHDPDWISAKDLKKLDSDLPSETNKGVDIVAWLKKEMEDKASEEETQEAEVVDDETTKEK